MNTSRRADSAAVAQLVANAIYELIPLPTARDAAAALPPGARVTITTSTRLGLDATISLAEWLSARGHDVAPHIAARQITDRAHVSDLLARLQSANIRTIFVVGGDGAAVGEIMDGLTLIRAMQDIGHHFDDIGVPAYPEGHPAIPDDVLLQDLRDKQPFVQAMTTQMSFNPTAVAEWIARVRHEGIVLPIHLGIPGVLGLRKLTTIAARIGVADSARYLMKNRGLLGHLAHMGSFGPDALLQDLAPTLADSRADIRALHVFTMNQVAVTAAWQRKMLDELSS
jgi:methylenetetrahydrofolate reductase (NADPH)